MSSFHAVNTTTLTVPESSITPHVAGETTPTTPRPGHFFPKEKPASDIPLDDSTVKTPTRDSFGGVSGQRPLPSEPLQPLRERSNTPSKTRMEPKRENSNQSAKSDGSDDIEMGGADEVGSDSEGEPGEDGKPSRKKKGQRFYCTEFPPCQLSFTRSEHLARHIRKHTGERPFQCHCSRRFSRLDNLRQHAQTVHVNEDIPNDSLAATGTRFQRQVRTDRVRPNHTRSRASTVGSQGGHSRGHSRNLSTSSIASTASSISTISNRDDSLGRRRPPPLAMANDATARARLSLDTFNPPLMGSPGPTFTTYGSQSPNAVGTPSSSNFSSSSPRFAPSVLSPHARNARPLTWAGSPPGGHHGRRLSVPSGMNPFQGPPVGSSFPPPYISPLPSAASSTYAPSNVTSPTSSVFSTSDQKELTASEVDLRRRTWHPTLHYAPRPATSGLSYSQTPGAAQPSSSTQSAANQTRLPGIENFDRPPPPYGVPRGQLSPMEVDSPVRNLAPAFDPSKRRPEERRNHHSVDLSIQRGIRSLNIANSSHISAWDSRPQQYPRPATGPRPTTAPHAGYPTSHPPVTSQNTYREPDSRPGDPPATPKRLKRQGWYHQPPPAQVAVHAPLATQQPQRPSPEGSSSSEGAPTPSTAGVAEYHPAIVHSNGYVEAHPHMSLEEKRRSGGFTHNYNADHGGAVAYNAPPPSYSFRPDGPPLQAGMGTPSARPEGREDLRRLDALVAVATGEQNAAVNRVS